MNKLKVLHLITHLGFGGASDNTLLTVERLPRDRYEVHLAAGQDYMDWAELGQEYADEFFLFPEMHRAPAAMADLRLLNRLTRFMREQQYDIVHTHNAKAGVLGRIAAHRAKVPVILHTFHLLSWQDNDSPRDTLLHRVTGTAKEEVYFRLEQYAAWCSDKVVTVCESNTQDAIARGLAPADKFTTIYSGIDLDKFQVPQTLDHTEKRRSMGLDPERPLVGMIGRLSPQKAPLDFVAAAKLTLQSCPEAQFIMVGDGTMTAEVEAAVADEPRIQILGYRDDVPEILPILDMFVLASLWEGLGRALTEAMIVGIPVVATAVNGIPELVIPGETGMLSPPRDPAKLAENMTFLLQNSQEAQRMSKTAQERVLPRFDANHMVDQIAALYEDLLAQKGMNKAVVSGTQSQVAQSEVLNA